MSLPWLFEFWALPHQLPPIGSWKTWVIMGGRGAGKTRAGSEWVRAEVEGARPLDAGRSKRVALVGETIEQVREVMIFGDSGILACSPPDRKPVWEATRKRLVWPNGAIAQAFSAHDPESLRGPQFDAAWVDELAKWKNGAETWDMLQFGLRLGDRPRQVVTTTPRNVGVLKAILKNPSTVVTHAPTEANRAHLAASFLDEIKARYDGTRLGRQELEGVLIEDADDALWTTSALEACRVDAAPALSRVVVAVDPPVTGHEGSDECGIVVVGVVSEGPPQRWRAFVLEDASVSAASPDQWARAAIAAMDRHGAERLVAEVNQGGDLVEGVLNGANVAAIGDGSSDFWEVIQFAGAVLVAPDTYDLTLRLRGQAGTDGIMPDVWPAGSRFVLLNGAAPQIGLSGSARDLARHYRIGTAQRPYDDPSYVHLVEAFRGIGLRPYAPCHLRAARSAIGDHSVAWTRRTRVDGDSWSSYEVPLGETRELYQVRVIAGGGIRRETEVVSPAWEYSAAMAAADGISGSFRVEVAQISDSFGPGPVAGIDLVA